MCRNGTSGPKEGSEPAHVRSHLRERARKLQCILAARELRMSTRDTGESSPCWGCVDKSVPMTANARASTHDLAPRGWACDDASAETSPKHRPPPHGRRRQRRERCTQDALELAAHKGGLRLLLGVLSAPTPGSRETRDVIRKTWLTAATREIQACFVIGSVGVADLASLDSEADHLGDLHFVQAREGVLRTS